MSHKNYETLPIASNFTNKPEPNWKQVFLVRVMFIVVFSGCFLFHSYCVFKTFAPESISYARRLEESREDVKCTAEDAGIATVVGGAVGVVLVGATFLALGLTPIGPVAGGWFAANMGAGLAAGSMMSVVQAAAMTGTTYGTALGLGAATGAATKCIA
jgi:hypothetical protein